MARDFAFSIDRGGTFTDVYAEFTDAAGARRQRVLKLLSEDPANYPDAPREGIRRVLESEAGEPHPRGVPLDTSRIVSIRMGTTVRDRGGATRLWWAAARRGWRRRAPVGGAGGSKGSLVTMHTQPCCPHSFRAHCTRPTTTTAML